MSQLDPIYIKIAEKMKQADSKAVPRLLQKIANMEQARIMCELPNTLEKITSILALDKAIVEKHLQYLYERGVVTPGKRGWNLVTNKILLKDFIGSAPDKYYDEEVIDLAREMSLEDPTSQAERLKRGEEITIRQGMRVIPKWRSIQDIPGVLHIEDLREIFRNNPRLLCTTVPVG
jgi:DNA-binding transcriptional ArsR family regulator